MKGYYESPEALVRFKGAEKREGRGQQREDKEGICPALGGLPAGRGETGEPRPPHWDHLDLLDPLRPALPSPGEGHSRAGGCWGGGKMVTGRVAPVGSSEQGRES